MSEAYKGSTSHSEYFFLQDATTGLGKTGLVYTDITASYLRAGGTSVSVTTAALAAVNSLFSPGGFKEVDAVNRKGLYRFDVPDAAYATGAALVVITLAASSIKTEHLRVDLIDWNKQVAAIPNAESGASGGLATVADVAAVLAALDAIDWSVTFTPVLTAASRGAVAGDDITQYQHASISFLFNATEDGASVDLSGKSVIFVVSTLDRVYLWQIAGTVTGENNDQVAIAADNTNTQAAATLRYSLWNWTDKRLLGRGSLEIAPEVAAQ